MLTHAPTLDANTAVGYLIARGGNTKLAAIDATRELNTTITEAQLLATIASDPTSLTLLAQQARLLVILQVLDAFRMTHTAYMQRLANLSPRDTAKAYTDLSSTLAMLGGPPQAPAQRDPFDEVLKKLPPEVADAVNYFLTPGAAPPAQDTTSSSLPAVSALHSSYTAAEPAAPPTPTAPTRHVQLAQDPTP